MSSMLMFRKQLGSLRASLKAPKGVSRRNYTTEAPLFKKILIANRGEIALRVMRTAKKMGIKTVAVFSEPDRHSLHVEMADEAVHIGPALSSDSYLRIDRIIAACKATGADAVHPGYGFLSENSLFVEECEKNGITFIGPPTSAMQQLGDKIQSKKVAKAAGVSIVPGFIGEVHDTAEVLKIANEIGYPVMVKASAGGGGKGMRIAWDDEEAAEGFRLSRQEAKAAFGDDRILIEKFIDNPRHIEFQVLADGQGNAVYLPERECSIQRRNQKVIEEAPSPFIIPEVRKAMGEEAVALAKAVNYKNTGTVEFLIDANHNYYFLEMNTRLQVEHPITEEITGIDIVEHMIRVAAGQKLALKQSDININGWAIESRVYAEDPLRHFLPSIGKLSRYKEPVENDGGKWIRSDSGIEEGSDISIYYDPLITKLVTTGPDRLTAIKRMRAALDSYVIRGLNHNVCFLRDVMENHRFIEGNLSTKFIPEEYPNGFHGHVLNPLERQELLTVATAVHMQRVARDAILSSQWESFERPINQKFSVRLGEETACKVFTTHFHNRVVEVTDDATGESAVVDLNQWTIDTPVVNCKWHKEGTEEYVPLLLQLISNDHLGYTFQYVGSQYKVEILTLKERELYKHIPKPKKIDSSKFLQSPMAGQLISVAVVPGQKVAIGQELAVVEAMKMQNVLRAEKDGIIKALKVEPGKSVSLDEILIEFEA